MSGIGNIGIVSSDRQALAAVLAAVGMVGVVEEPEVRLGELGGCVACGHTVLSHFKEGRWLGCFKGEEDTVYILVPAPKKGEVRTTSRKAAVQPQATAQEHANGNGHAAEAAPATEPVVAGRGFKRARYTSALHHKANPNKLELSPTRLKVLRTIHKTGKSGLVAKQIMTKARLPHGSVQQTLNWLRAHDLVRAQEDAA